MAADAGNWPLSVEEAVAGWLSAALTVLQAELAAGAADAADPGGTGSAACAAEARPGSSDKARAASSAAIALIAGRSALPAVLLYALAPAALLFSGWTAGPVGWTASSIGRGRGAGCQ